LPATHAVKRRSKINLSILSGKNYLREAWNESEAA
jgi:hypothetical protein